MRYYYKQNNTENTLSLKSPLSDTSDYTEITEEEFNAAQNVKLTTPTYKYLAKQEISECKTRLRELDYIGVKIATGRATIQEYSEQIAEMNRLANRINELEEDLES